MEKNQSNTDWKEERGGWGPGETLPERHLEPKPSGPLWLDKSSTTASFMVRLWIPTSHAREKWLRMRQNVSCQWIVLAVQVGVILTAQTFGKVWGTFCFYLHAWGRGWVLLASSGWRPLSNLQHTWQITTTEAHLTPSVNKTDALGIFPRKSLDRKW